MTKAAENMFMEQPPDPSHTTSHAQAISSALNRLWVRYKEEYGRLLYYRGIGWYDSETLKSEDRILVKREEPYDLPTI